MSEVSMRAGTPQSDQRIVKGLEKRIDRKVASMAEELLHVVMRENQALKTKNQTLRNQVEGLKKELHQDDSLSSSTQESLITVLSRDVANLSRDLKIAKTKIKALKADNKKLKEDVVENSIFLPKTENKRPQENLLEISVLFSLGLFAIGRFIFSNMND